VLSLAFRKSFKGDETRAYDTRGAFTFRRAEWFRVKERIATSLEREGESSQYVRARFLGNDAKSVTALLNGLVESVRTAPPY
jgi:hypothetical protein